MSDHPFRPLFVEVDIVPSAPVSLDAIGAYCAAEWNARRPTPAKAHVSPRTFRTLADEGNAYVFAATSAAPYFLCMTIGGVVMVVSDRTQPDDETLYEIRSDSVERADDLAAMAERTKADEMPRGHDAEPQSMT